MTDAPLHGGLRPRRPASRYAERAVDRSVDILGLKHGWRGGGFASNGAELARKVKNMMFDKHLHDVLRLSGRKRPQYPVVTPPVDRIASIGVVARAAAPGRWP